ncbi:uracil-DNA glycosylase [Cyprinid herpesvirus 3]|uniref:Probable uracil DNA glycosylase n=1 Tax=Cyprinid herpesvirus 3 TaxID=180230 RepID=A4FTJ3_CYHV3|nr:uracil-DNA glycosylase [Cyprinid herpesvirus 3]AOO32818.1 uracil-DNA glycosylase [Cyprinid herpesvirus 3]AOO32975.1 uracil-DNA glycosylase [Cyprinid herpesvirus 3]AOO33130.1 uracil-DNA glycosylase [Cyprinid herpesvirus 3]AOO33287.1 uracil-DNA glycosylase [Cyprinid herpesvirus 3]
MAVPILMMQVDSAVAHPSSPTVATTVDHVQIQQTLTRLEIRQRFRGERVDIGIDTEDIDHLKINHEISALKREIRREQFNNEDDGPPPPEPEDETVFELVSALPRGRGSWHEFFLRELGKAYTVELLDLLRERRDRLTPRRLCDVLRAFSFFKSPRQVRVLLLGNKALKWKGYNGMGFGTEERSDSYQLTNLRKELGGDYDPTLESWAKQGVLCLSVGLTCAGEEDHSEAWAKLVEAAVAKCLSANKQLQSIAIGYDARKLFNTAVATLTGSLSKEQCVFTTDYLYRSDFIASRVFAHTNTQLQQHKIPQVQWTLTAEPR